MKCVAWSGFILLLASGALAAGSVSSPVPPPDPKAPKCDSCEYTCMFAEKIVDSERFAFLYEKLAPVVKSEVHLEKQVRALSDQWGKRDAQNPTAPSMACYRSVLNKKTEAEVQKVIDHSSPIQREAMETDWTTSDCKIHTNGLESKVCAPLYNALAAHELSHHQSCKQAWADPSIGAKAANAMKNKTLRAADEVRAYKAGIARMEQEMKKLAKKKGCGLRPSRNQLAPPASQEEIDQAMKDIENIPIFMRSSP